MPDFFSSSTLWASDAQQIPYDFYTCRIFIEGDMGTAALPVAAPFATTLAGQLIPLDPTRPWCEIIQTVAPYGRRIVQWACQRLGGLPKVPHPDPLDANQRLAKYAMAMDTPPLQEDGANHVYRLGATYIYDLLQPIWLLDNLGMGATPYDLTPAAVNVFSAAFFTYGLQGSPVGGLG